MAGTVLAACAGIVNAVAWLELGAFVSHMTGNMSKVGIRIQGAHVGRNDLADVVEAMGLVASFMAGAVMCGLLVTSSVVRFGRELYGLALIGNSSFLLVAMVLSKHPSAKYLAAAACGLQNGMCTSHFGAVCRTTHVTGLVTDAGTALGRLLAVALRRCARHRRSGALDRAETEVEAERLWVYFCLGAGFLLGTKTGAWLAHWLGAFGLAVPAAVTGLGGVACCARWAFVTHQGADEIATAMHAAEAEQLDGIIERAKQALQEASQQEQIDVPRFREVAKALETSISQLRRGWVGEASGDDWPAVGASCTRAPGDEATGDCEAFREAPCNGVAELAEA